MIRFAVVTVTLAVIYLLMLTSIHPGDVLMGVALGAVVAIADRRALVASGRHDRRNHAVSGGHGVPSPIARALAVPGLAVAVGSDLVRGTWQVARHCLRRRPTGTPGIVAIPIGDRSPSGLALWGLITGVAPDEVVVDIDEERGLLLVHVLDAGNPDAVRARHHDFYERRQRRVIP